MILHVHSDASYVVFLDKVASISQIVPHHRSENFDKIEYRYAYSFDNATWSEWFVNDTELITHLSTNPTNFGNIYAKVELSVIKAHTLAYSYYKLLCVQINGVDVAVKNMQRARKTDILRRTNTKNLYRPYRDTSEANKLNKIMARGVSDIFSFETTYFRTEADEDARMTTFKTFPLINVKEYKSLPVLINNNELPDSRFQFSEFDYDFADELEIHIVIEVWKEIFGVREPNANDYLFLPLTNRMYQINTVHDAKDFMNTATFYRAMLVKFENRADVIDLPDDDILDGYAEYTDDFDNERVKDEAADALKTMLHTPTEVDNDSEVATNAIVYNGLSVVDFLYDFTSKENNILASSYEVAQTKDEFSLAFWFKLPTLSSKYVDSPTAPVRQLNIVSAEDDNNKRLMRVFASNLNSLTAELEISPTQKLSINCVGQILEADRAYGFLMNYAYNEVGTFVSMTIINDTFEIVAEIVDSAIPKLPKMINHIHLHGGISLGNFRLKKTFTNKNQILKELSDKLPEPSKYYVADNAVAPLHINEAKASDSDCPIIQNAITGNRITSDKELERILAIIQDPDCKIEDVSTIERSLLTLPNMSIVYNTDNAQYEQLVNNVWKSLLIGKQDTEEFEAW